MMNHSNINETMLQSIRGEEMSTQDVGKVLGYIFYPLLWTALWMMSVFVISNIIAYIKSKPPDAQTLLDRFYVHLFWVWIALMTVIAIYTTMVEIGVKVWGVAMVVGSLYYSLMLLNALYLLESCICRIVMIFNLIEQVNKEKILKFTRLVHIVQCIHLDFLMII